jgi:hypothetical protein
MMQTLFDTFDAQSEASHQLTCFKHILKGHRFLRNSKNALLVEATCSTGGTVDFHI